MAIEGIDGAGKGTQARRLVERLNTDGVRSELLSFPRYGQTAFARRVADFLNGRLGALDELDPFEVSLLYAGDRCESRDMLLDSLRTNAVLVIDRYVASNSAHQGAKRTGREREELLGRIERIEYGLYDLPRPGLVLLLDLPVAQAQQLIARKSARAYTDKQADLQEADADYLERVRQVYLELAKGPEWRRIEVVRNGSVRPVEDIGEQLFAIVKQELILAALPDGGAEAPESNR